MPRCLRSSLLLITATLGFAQGFSTSNAQLLYGSSFRDKFSGNHVWRGGLTTLTLEHFRTGPVGDLFAFVDLGSGRLADFGGAPLGRDTKAYGEVAPRLNLATLLGRRLKGGIVKDTYLAAQWNQADSGFRVWMVGLGVDLDVPGLASATFNAYVRKDTLNRRTWQTTTTWAAPFQVSAVGCRFQGFVDLCGTDSHGTDLMTQSQLLADLGPAMGLPPARLWAGVEYYVHRHDHVDARVLQAMVKVVIH